MRFTAKLLLMIVAGTVIASGQKPESQDPARLMTFTVEGEPGAGTTTIEARTMAITPDCKSQSTP
jgi:hypothetical protein